MILIGPLLLACLTGELKKRSKLTKGLRLVCRDQSEWKPVNGNLPMSLYLGPTSTQVFHNHDCRPMDPASPYTFSTSVPCRPSKIDDESPTFSGHMTSLAHIDLPILFDSPILDDWDSRASIYDNTSRQQESHQSPASYTITADSSSTTVSTYQCADCPKQYRRKTDLSRHAKSHNMERRFDCPIVSCKFRGRKANSRRDKFISHLLKGHPEVGTWPCLVRDCSTAVENVLLLGVHLDSHAPWSLGNSIVKAHSITKTKCPIERCGKPLTPNHLFKHHSQMERQAEADSLCALGFDYQQSALLCPICHERFSCSTEGKIWIQDLEKVSKHMHTKHLGYEPGRRRTYVHTEDSNKMWQDPQTFYHCREQIIRFDCGSSYIEFRGHAVFNDVRV